MEWEEKRKHEKETLMGFISMGNFEDCFVPRISFTIFRVHTSGKRHTSDTCTIWRVINFNNCVLYKNFSKFIFKYLIMFFKFCVWCIIFGLFNNLPLSFDHAWVQDIINLAFNYILLKNLKDILYYFWFVKFNSFFFFRGIVMGKKTQIKNTQINSVFNFRRNLQCGDFLFFAVNFRLWQLAGNSYGLGDGSITAYSL